MQKASDLRLFVTHIKQFFKILSVNALYNSIHWAIYNFDLRFFWAIFCCSNLSRMYDYSICVYFVPSNLLFALSRTLFLFAPFIVFYLDHSSLFCWVCLWTATHKLCLIWTMTFKSRCAITNPDYSICIMRLGSLCLSHIVIQFLGCLFACFSHNFESSIHFYESNKQVVRWIKTNWLERFCACVYIVQWIDKACHFVIL